MASSDTIDRARRLRIISFDVDGVLTDGRLYYTEDGLEIKAFNVQDGAAMKLLQSEGIEVAFLTGRKSPMVERRAAELGIRHLFQGLDDKTLALDKLCADTGCSADQVAHVGDDLPDIPVFTRVGLAISVPNAHPAVLRQAHHVTTISGGEGVAREVAELVLRAQERWRFG